MHNGAAKAYSLADNFDSRESIASALRGWPSGGNWSHAAASICYWNANSSAVSRTASE